MTNLELFDHYAKKVLATLAELFPVEQEITLKMLTEMDDIYEPANEGEWQRTMTKDAVIAFNTVKWLMNSGYLCYRKYEDCSFFNTYLTEKGIATAGLKIQITQSPE